VSKSDGIRRFFMARGTWLVAGLLAGLALGLSIAWMAALDPPVTFGPRTLRVGEGRDYSTIAGALAAAAPRDIVEIAPGEYQEALVVPSGVQLLAKVPGSVTLRAPEQSRDAIAITLSDGTGTRISGIRIVGSAQRPFAAGIRLAATDVTVDDVWIEANVDTGIDIVSDGDVTVRTTRFSGITGVPIRVGPMARPHLERDVFVHDPPARMPAIDVASDTNIQLRDNVFVGYPDAIKTDAARRGQLLQDNLIVGAPPASPRGSR
jgi:hypothetical protein